MKRMKSRIMLFVGIFCLQGIMAQESTNFKGKKLILEAVDGVKITADFYEIEEKNAPIILLFHQANYSRGEYRSIAPTLNQMGFHCLAIDQRSGKTINGVENETHKEAVKLKKGTLYPDAIPDLEAALVYAKSELSAEKIIIWGSSYSSSLVFYLAAKHPEDIAAILSFSPGEYFTVEDKTVRLFSAKVKCPVFITSAKKEKGSWQAIYDAIPSEKTFFLPEKNGFHGSKALWPSREGSESYWMAVDEFLKQFRNN